MPVFLKHESHNNFSFWDFKFLKFTQLFSKLWRSAFSNFRPEIEKANEFEKLHLIIFSFDFNQSPSFISIHSSFSPSPSHSLSLPLPHFTPHFFWSYLLSLFLILFPSIFLFLSISSSIFPYYLCSSPFIFLSLLSPLPCFSFSLSFSWLVAKN